MLTLCIDALQSEKGGFEAIIVSTLLLQDGVEKKMKAANFYCRHLEQKGGSPFPAKIFYKVQIYEPQPTFITLHHGER